MQWGSAAYTRARSSSLTSRFSILAAMYEQDAFERRLQVQRAGRTRDIPSLSLWGNASASRLQPHTRRHTPPAEHQIGIPCAPPERAQSSCNGVRTLRVSTLDVFSRCERRVPRPRHPHDQRQLTQVTQSLVYEQRRKKGPSTPHMSSPGFWATSQTGAPEADEHTQHWRDSGWIPVQVDTRAKTARQREQLG
jgi:hypothetical protein